MPNFAERRFSSRGNRSSRRKVSPGVIKVVTVPGEPHRGVLFPFSAAVKRHVSNEMHGVEFGAAAHNPFGLPGAINVAPVGVPGSHDHMKHEGYRQAQVTMCGAYVLVDKDGTITASGLPDRSQDFVVTSHVLEHCPNPLAAFHEWNRILKPDGVVACVVPKRDALARDGERPITRLDAIVKAFRDDVDVDSPGLEALFPGMRSRRGHYTVWDPNLILSVIRWANTNLDLRWRLVEFLPTDDKVGNGHLFVTRYTPSRTESLTRGEREACLGNR